MKIVDEANWGSEVLKASQRIPILVNFGAPWCGLCQIIKPLLHQFETEQSDCIQILNINADENLKLASTYKITSLPTLLLFIDGKPVERFEKFRDRDEIKQCLAKIAITASLVSV